MEGAAEATRAPKDTVKLDQLWKDTLKKQDMIALDWEKKWGFLRKVDHLGKQKKEEIIPDHMSLYSDHLPNTTNQVYGCRQATPLGQEIIRMDRMFLWPGLPKKKPKKDSKKGAC